MPFISAGGTSLSVFMGAIDCKKPSEVSIGLKFNRPYVSLTFNSTTSNSVREYRLLQHGVVLYVNDHLNTSNEEELDKVWSEFQDNIRYTTELENSIAISSHKTRGRELMQQAEKLLSFDDFFERENNFLKEHQDDEYLGFGVEAFRTPVFIKNTHQEDCQYIRANYVKPFSPKTLEFCVSRLTQEAKIEEGESLDYFRRKCKRVQSLSVYETDDWDKVIAKTSSIVENCYKSASTEMEK